MTWPSPAIVGATKTSSRSTRSCSRKAVASVGPPSSSSDWTPSPPRRAQLVLQRPGEQLQLGVFGQWAAAEGDPARLTRCVDVARVEPRIVRTNGAHAHGHRIGGGAELVHATTALLACHPAGAGHGHAPVEGDGELERHERPPRRDPGAPGLVLRPRLEGVGVLDLDAGCGEQARGRRGPPGSGRASRRPLSPRPPQHGLRARRRRAVVGAGLHRHVERRAAGALAGRLERDHLGVRAALALVPALADDVAAGDDDRADDRIRPSRAAPALGELDRPLEMSDALASRHRLAPRSTAPLSPRSRLRLSCEGLDEAPVRTRQVLPAEDRRTRDDQVGPAS